MITALIILLIVVALVMSYLLSISPYFKVERHIDIKCTAQAAFQQVAALSTWKQWNPWLINEPECPLSFSDKSDEEGGYYEWNGFLIGAGRVTHKKLDAPTAIRQNIIFTRPFKSTSTINWTFTVKNSSITTVTWTMNGRLSFFLRPFAKKMEGMLGPDYELGLILLRNSLDSSNNQLKISFGQVVEKKAQTHVAQSFIDNVNQLLMTAQKTLPKLLKVAGDKKTGASCIAYKKVLGADVNFSIGVPVEDDTEILEGYEHQTFFGGHYFVTEQQGSYEYLRYTWKQAYAHVRLKKMQIDSQRYAYEVYEKTPEETVTNQLKTTLYIPVKNIN